jgi:sugar phosphate isomerase/epimerase
MTIDTVYRGLFPFRIECPSWVYPEDFIPNVEMTGPFVDSVELILFESSEPFHLPGPEVFARLAELREELGVGYSVHLPLDVRLGSADSAERNRGAETYTRFINASLCLAPLQYYMHLDSKGREHGAGAWEQRTSESIDAVLKETGIHPGLLHAETLEYPLGDIRNLIEQKGLGVCLDTGHCMEFGISLDRCVQAFGERIGSMHVHAASGEKSHLPLDMLSDGEREQLGGVLNGFSGTVCAEVFSKDSLVRSLESLRGICNV